MNTRRIWPTNKICSLFSHHSDNDKDLCFIKMIDVLQPWSSMMGFHWTVKPWRLSWQHLPPPSTVSLPGPGPGWQNFYFIFSSDVFKIISRSASAPRRRSRSIPRFQGGKINKRGGGGAVLRGYKGFAPRKTTGAIRGGKKKGSVKKVPNKKQVPVSREALDMEIDNFMQTR